MKIHLYSFPVTQNNTEETLIEVTTEDYLLFLSPKGARPNYVFEHLKSELYVSGSKQWKAAEKLFNMAETNPVIHPISEGWVKTKRFHAFNSFTDHLLHNTADMTRLFLVLSNELTAADNQKNEIKKVINSNKFSSRKIAALKEMFSDDLPF